MSWVVIQIERTPGVVGFIYAEVVDAVRLGSDQGIVAIVDEGDGKSRAEMGNAREFPALRPSVRGVEEALARKLITVAGDKVMPHIKRGQAFAECGVERIDCLPYIRRLILRFGIGVSGKHV